MEGNFTTTREGHVIQTQMFNGKEFKLHKGERYFSRGTTRMHREVWKFHNGEIPKGYDIHHVDGDTTNNCISNLNLVHKSLHRRFTGKKRFKDNPEFVKEFHAKGVEAAKEWHKSEEGREWHSKHGKQTWVNREQSKKKCIVCDKEYETTFPSRSKYCHQNCKAKALRKRRKL